MTSDGSHQRTTRQRRQDGRPPESFKGAPDGDKGREGERANGTAATEHTAAGAEGQAEGRQKGRRHGWPRAWGVEEGARRSTAAGREQGENEKKEIYKYLRERRRGKTPPRLAKACKCVYIHIT